MTTLNISLSGTLQAELNQQGVWAYAVYFDSNGAPHWTDLVNNGSIQSSGSIAGTETISLPGSFIGGKVYFLVQSQATSQPNNLQTLITAQSDINWNNGSLYDFRYDSFEVTLQNAAADAGNLSSVNGFGLPMEVSVPYDNSTTATVGYGISASTLVSDIQNINTALPSNEFAYNYTSGPLNGDFRMALSPTVAVTPDQTLTNPSPFSNSDWNSYVTSLEGPQAQDIVLSGQFNGAPSVEQGVTIWHNGGYFAYQLEWDGTYFWLDPLATSQIQGDIRISPTDLENSIYSTLGNANIYTNQTDTTPYTDIGLTEPMNTGANNQWGKVLSEFLTGFTGGVL